MKQYTFDLESEAERMTVVEVVGEVLQKSMPGKLGMDFNFDDMLWWPIILGLEPPHYDVLLADEVQDFNACQIELVRRMMAKGCRVVAVGDPYQAVYRFRGADSKAFFRLAEVLANGSGRCQELTLPTNYRCGKAHIEYVRQHTIVKEIEAAPTACEGEIIVLDYNGVLDLVTEDLLQTA
jgi:superfamily I DNA/RNA helicase